MRPIRLPGGLLIVVALILLLFAGCGLAGGDTDTPTPTPTRPGTTPTPSGRVSSDSCAPSSAASSLTGDGSTFVQPFFQDVFDRWDRLCNVQVNYQGVGSGQGIQDLTNKSVDFADSDAIMSDEQKASAPGKVLHIPMVSDAVGIIYHISGVDNLALTFDAKTLADIFLGNVTKWSDPEIAKLNPGVTLPDQVISPVHRADGSGTTFIFTDYLSKVSSEWASRVGEGTAVDWPTGAAGNGSAGLAATVQELPGSIGYVSFAYAIQTNIDYARVINSSGDAIEPTLQSAEAAQRGVALPDNMEILLTNSANADAYPICGYTWMLLYAEQEDKAKSIQLAHLVKWLLTDAQQFSEGLTYVPLGDDAVQKALAELNSVTYQGTPITQLQ